MRTTVDIADDVLAAAKAIAATEGRSIGHVLSRLARRGLAPPSGITDGRLPTFAVPADAPPLTGDLVRRAQEED